MIFLRELSKISITLSITFIASVICLSANLALAAGGGSAGHGGKPYDLNAVKQPVPDPAKATAPKAPQLLEPEALQKVSGTNVTLKWQATEGAEVYHVQVATDPNFKWLIVDEQSFPQTSIQPQGLVLNKNYFWRVAARKPTNDAGATKSFFSSSSFTTR